MQTVVVKSNLFLRGELMRTRGPRAGTPCEFGQMLLQLKKTVTVEVSIYCVLWLVWGVNKCVHSVFMNEYTYIFPRFLHKHIIVDFLILLPLMFMLSIRYAFLGDTYDLDPLEKGMATHSRILAWIIPWTEEPGRLESLGSQRAGHDLVTWHACMTYILNF